MQKTRFQRALSYAGAMSGSRAFSAPFLVQIDVENMCNLSCIACWSNSPLLKEKRRHDSLSMDLGTFQSLSRDMGKMGVTRVELAGLGEPFLHPDIYEILECIGRSALYSTVVTNGTRIRTGSDVQRLCASGLNELQVSLWAGSEGAYVKTHPSPDGRSLENFARIVEALHEVRIEKRHGRTKLKINLVNIMMKLNADDIVNMAELATVLNVDKVIFREVSVFTETKQLSLEDNDKRIIRECAGKAEAIMERAGIVNNLEAFLRSFRPGAESKDDEEKTNGNLSDLPYKRRCMVGWNLCRIAVDGNVTPCCHCGFNMGNVKKASLHDIWYSEKYDALRRHMLADLDDSSFCEACVRSCAEPKNLRGSAVYRFLDKYYFTRYIDKRRRP